MGVVERVVVVVGAEKGLDRTKNRVGGVEQGRLDERTRKRWLRSEEEEEEEKEEEEEEEEEILGLRIGRTVASVMLVVVVVVYESLLRSLLFKTAMGTLTIIPIARARKGDADNEAVNTAPLAAVRNEG
ncbi:hypothetical protein M0802_003138 [Mischocyttarus mexicanus]|nr:hypothetical protein M0802_003138 [Mischocyttarus mexicanus]